MEKIDKAHPKDLEKIEEHFRNAPKEAIEKLEEMRELLKKEVPGAVEGLSYAMPTVRYKGKAVVCYFAWKNHFGFYPMGEMHGYDDDLKDLQLSASKGAVQIPYDQKLPISFIKKVVKNRLKSIEEGQPMYKRK